MRKLIAGAALALTITGLVTAGTAGAAKEDLPFVCDGVPTNISVAGGSRIGVIDGVTYKAVIFYAQDTEGNIRYAKSYGNTGKQLSGDSITCTQTSDEGTVTVIAVPVV